MVAEEMWINRSYKERVVAADGTESVVVKKAIRDHHRVYRNESAHAVLELDDRKVTDFEQYRASMARLERVSVRQAAQRPSYDRSQ